MTDGHDPGASGKAGALILRGKVEKTLVAHQFGATVSMPFPKIDVLVGHGIRGDNHAGPRLACVREREMINAGLPKGIGIANFRGYSAVSAEELQEIATAMGIDTIPPGLLCENLIISGIPNLTRLPSGTLIFFKKPSGQMRTAVLTVTDHGWWTVTIRLLDGPTGYRIISRYLKPDEAAEHLIGL